MLDHVSIGVRDRARAGRFYDAVLKPLGYSCLSDATGARGCGGDHVALWLLEVERPVMSDSGSGLHICFSSPTRAAVDGFHATALAGGGKDNGLPGPRSDYGPNYYAGLAIDLDGCRIEAYCGNAA
jgi:catechol 2,3-dioxygenase-like lactoylglutathione lyase family enzyme